MEPPSSVVDCPIRSPKDDEPVDKEWGEWSVKEDDDKLDQAICDKMDKPILMSADTCRSELEKEMEWSDEEEGGEMAQLQRKLYIGMSRIFVVEPIVRREVLEWIDTCVKPEDRVEVKGYWDRVHDLQQQAEEKIKALDSKAKVPFPVKEFCKRVKDVDEILADPRWPPRKTVPPQRRQEKQ